MESRERVSIAKRKAPLGLSAADGNGSSLTAVQARSLAQQVADSIVDGIASGVLAPGQRVLEVELARKLRVSRVPVREALKSLGAQGILESAAHRGTYIALFDDANVDKICEVRAALEKIAVRHATKTYAALPEELGKLRAIIHTMEQCVGREDWIGVNKADIAFHREICIASRNEIVMTLWDTLARHVLIIFGREILSKKERSRIVQQHELVLSLLEAGNEAQLEVEIDTHIMQLRRKVSATKTMLGARSKTSLTGRRRLAISDR